jgi:hypothetical protein
MKRFFIRKSPSELIQEQNRLLETLLAKQDEKPIIQQQHKDSLMKQEPETKVEDTIDYFFDLDENFTYVPTASKSSARLSVDTSKVPFVDERNIEKLKKARNT